MKSEVRKAVAETISRYLTEYCETNGTEPLWGEPLVGFADAHDPRFAQLKELVQDSHYLPEDILPGATVVVSYFLPFNKDIAHSNISGELASPEWAFAYMATNNASIGLGEAVCETVRGFGFDAESPKDIKRTEGTIVSRWSQRHIAYIAGLGSFGMNNMLITEKGCCGRFYSVVTALDIEPDQPVDWDNCPYKSHGRCGACMSKCRSGALRPEGFDRHACDKLCNENSHRYNGISVCGKCIVGMPCSFRNPRVI